MKPTQHKPRAGARERPHQPTRSPTVARRGSKALRAEAEETLAAIRSGQVDALVIESDKAHSLYALKAFDEIERTEAALQLSSAEIARSEQRARALMEERERLFQDMHDGCIQSIYAVGLNLETSLRLVETNPKKVSQVIAESSATLNLVIQELRAFITGRKPGIEAGETLRSEIERVASAAKNHGLDILVSIEDKAMRSLSADQALHMLQISRESISNAVRHAKAKHGRVSLQRVKTGVRLEIRDDGVGFDPAAVAATGLGLHHIDARARKMGGKARVHSRPGKGTKVVIDLSIGDSGGALGTI